MKLNKQIQHKKSFCSEWRTWDSETFPKFSRLDR